MTVQARPGRRRFIGIAAATAGLGLLRHGAAAQSVELQTWQGTALGARAAIRLYHPDPAFARAVIGRARAEIDRLEQIFSLYRPDSAVCRLNRRGVLHAPPLDLVRLLAEARRYSEATGGAFDVTVQALWRLYARHFDGDERAVKGPDPAAVAEALARVDHRSVSVDAGRIGFEKPNMAITLNGVAQGYITDRVADLLRRAGLDNVLLDLGEMRALGRHAEGRPWQIGLRDPRRREGIDRTLELDNAALATSASYGTRFDAAGRYHHLLDPRTGRSSNRYLSISVKAPSATTADALSTGLYHLDQARIAEVVGQFPGVEAIVTHSSGEMRIWTA